MTLRQSPLDAEHLAHERRERLHEADEMRVEQRPVPDPGSGETSQRNAV